MSTATRNQRAFPQEGPAATALAPPPKLRRRPALVAAAVAAVCVGALLAAWAWGATTNTQEVLVARHTIDRGSVIAASDLERVRLSADPALHPVPGSAFNDVVGQRAALDIAVGIMLTPDSFTSTMIPGHDQSVVGVSLTPARVPGLGLHSGDQVRVVVTPGQGDDIPPGTPPFNEAQVVGVHTDESSGNTIVDLLVSHADAALLAERAATGNVALVLDSREN